MDKLQIGVFQMDLEWEHPEANLSKINNLLENNNQSLDLLVLPEMFTTGFSMQASHLAWTVSHPDFKYIQSLAIEYNCSIIGSVWFKENDKFYNRCFHWDNKGNYEYYDKIHVFTLVKEDQYITSGTESKYFTVRNWKIKPQICYDLRFPRQSYNLGNEPYDVLLYVANWPIKRIDAWDILLKARAVENQSYVIGVNRVGQEPSGIQYSGHSAIVSYTGETLGNLPENTEGILVFTLDKTPQNDFRNRFPFIKDEI